MKLYLYPLPTEDFNPLFYCPRTYHDILQSGLQNLHESGKNELVNKPDKDTYIIYAMVPHDENIKYKNNNLLKLIENHPNKIIIVDNSDENNKHYLKNLDSVFLYFKRSLYKWDGNFNREYIPQHVNTRFFTYSVTEGMSLYYNIPYGDRHIDVGCYLRPAEENRRRVLSLLQHIHQLRPQWNMHIGPVSTSTRSDGQKTIYDRDYFSTLQQTKINIVCQPPWIGSSREWESLSQQCLTFIDKPFVVPGNYPINFTTHVDYSLSEPDQFLYNLDRLINNTVEAERIAKAGHDWAFASQQSVHRCEYIVDCIQQKLDNRREIVLSSH